jgi:acetyltransferase-like isoleucine patch superfamily enzyme
MLLRVTGKSIEIVEVERHPSDPPALGGSSDKARRILSWQPGYPRLDEIIKTVWLRQSAGIGEEVDFLIRQGRDITAANRIVIGKNVLLAPNVSVADTNHKYQHVGISIMHQGITTHSDQVCIGDDTWIGMNSVIVGDVKIGTHCVIGANAVVTKDLPDYCVVVGNPCRFVRVFDVESESRENIGDVQEIDKILAKRAPISNRKDQAG